MEYPKGKTCTRCQHSRKHHEDGEGSLGICKSLRKDTHPCRCIGFTGNAK